MPNTTYGTPYVASSDLVSAYPGVSSTLATRVDDISLKGNGINAQTASYTLVLADGGKNVTMTVASANTLTVPANASVAFPTGVCIGVVNLGAGACTITPAGTVTVNGTSLVLAQYEAGVLLKTATNTWVFSKGGGFPKASYSATTGSPTVTTVSGKTCVKFTGSGSITISGSGGMCDILLVGGGGGGGNTANNVNTLPGAGGGGGVLYATSAFVSSGTLTVTVGAGGSGGGGDGTPSALTEGYVALGGGSGSPQAGSTGRRGGSGGGGSGGGASAVASNGGTAYLSWQGNAGGNGSTANVVGSGGGAGGAASGGTAGVGLANSITGSSVTYAAGGTGNNATAGAANTGNGGGGGTTLGGSGAAGGSGVVILLFG